jgi:hypothetical protein
MNATSQLDSLVAFLNEALPRLLPGETIRVEDGIVYGAGDAVTIQETEIERKTILGPQKFPGWSISRWNYIPSTQWEPADVQEEEIGTYNGWLQAASAFLIELFSHRINAEEERQSNIS